ncbi:MULTISPECIES: class I SAM-dependent methyltransferase [Sorangium]|nr:MULTISPECIES: class I SAM-dependent methyltransferase [Sorangium]
MTSIDEEDIDPAYAEFLDRELPRLHAKEIDRPVLDFVLDSVARPEGLVMEFGVFSGTTVNRIADACPDERVFGFDSFEGFPEAWGIISKEASKQFFSRRPPEVRKNVTLVEGWFDRTLPEFLKEHPQQCSLVHIDCDLYVSTATVLESLRSRIVPGTVLVFDEMVNMGAQSALHEMKAWWEFVRDSKIQFEWLCLGYDCGVVFQSDARDTEDAPEELASAAGQAQGAGVQAFVETLHRTRRRFNLPRGLKVAGAVKVH